MDFDELMGQFRRANRELFNNFFLNLEEDGWLARERYTDVEFILFQRMVLSMFDIQGVGYGKPEPAVRVVIAGDHSSAPIMINREIDSPYFDFPVDQLTRDAVLHFVKFFDWSPTNVCDHQYVEVQINDWPSHPETKGKIALIENLHVKFELVLSDEQRSAASIE